MNKKLYDNPLRRQCESLALLCSKQIDGVKKGLSTSIPKNEISRMRNVIITGCGDSLFAARACVPAFKQFNKAFGNNFVALRCIDAARNYEYNPQNNSATLVVCISASGGPARIKEVILRAKANQCKTLLVTNNPSSMCAKEADYTLVVNTPSFPESDPGLRNYYASLIGLYALAAYMGEAKGLSPKGTLEELFKAIAAFTGAYAKIFETVDEQMCMLALAWKDFTAFETVADNIDFSSAYFIAAKLVETAGVLAPTVDTEHWCHVNYFAHNPANIGTIFVSNIHENNLSRIAETIYQASRIGRPALLITNGSAESYTPTPNTAVTVCSVPSPPPAFSFMGPLLNYLPGALFASYIAKIRGEIYFRGGESPQRTSLYGSRIVNSNISIV